jgi:hypothetical protein
MSEKALAQWLNPDVLTHEDALFGEQDDAA